MNPNKKHINNRYPASITLGLLMTACISLSVANSNANEKQKPLEIEQSMKPGLENVKNDVQRKIKTVQVPLYVPPLRGAPKRRVGGGTRSQNTLSVTALTPDHTGLTLSPQPALYYFYTGDKENALEFTLIAADAEAATFEAPISVNDEKLQVIDLENLDVHLSPNTEYLWYVTIIVNPKKRAKDIVTGGAIKYVPPTESLQKELTQTEKSQHSIILAKQGIWYDAIAATQYSPQTKPYLRPLISQVGLNFALEH